MISLFLFSFLFFKTSDAIDRGDLAAAIKYSKRAKYYAIAAMIIGTVFILTLTLLFTLQP